MVTPVSPQITPPTNPPKTTKTSIFYINDVHSNILNLERLKSASDEFDSFVPSEPTDKLKFSAGDIGVGREKSLNQISVGAQNSMGIMAMAGGNHELDLNKKELAEVLKDANYKILGMNVEIPQTSPENKDLSKNIIKSYVQEQNGTKYGVIGLMPFDFFFHLSDPELYEDFDIKQIDKTIPLVQAEIDKMKEQGIDKIVVLSHCGYSDDVELAKSIEGIDVIVGGHTHDLIKGIKENKNLFYSKKTGAPTIITQAGKNGDYFGVLNLEFDDKGMITKAQNNVVKTSAFPKNPISKVLIDNVLGKPQVIGFIKSSPKFSTNLIDENPGVNFLIDAQKAELDVDLVISNAGNVRAPLEEGPLTNRDLQMITPFDNKVWIIKLTEKDLVNALKAGAKSLTSVDTTPGILQVSGLKYTMTKSGELKAATFIDKEGKETPIDVNNPNPFKTYRVGADDFIAKGGNNYLPPNMDNVEKKFPYNKNKFIIDYLKKQNKPVEVNPESRITVLNE